MCTVKEIREAIREDCHSQHDMESMEIDRVLQTLPFSQGDDLLDAMDSEQATPSLSQAQRLKKFSQEGHLSIDVMQAIMGEEKKSDLDKVTFTSDTLRKYFPKSYTPQRMQETIIKLLEQWQKKRQQQHER